MTTREQTKAAEWTFNMRTGISATRFRSLAGSMKEFYAITIDHQGAEDFDREAVRTGAGWNFRGIPVRFKSDNLAWRQDSQREITLDLLKSAFIA
jgi:hypothetical protein